MGGDNNLMPSQVVNQDLPKVQPAAPLAGQQPIMRGQSPWGGSSPGGDNPFLQQYGQDMSQMYPQAMQAQNQMNGLDKQSQLYGGGSLGALAASSSTGTNPASSQSAYPAYPNSFGLGDTSAFTQQAPNFAPQPTALANPGFSAQPLNQSPSGIASNGLSPWSMTGEANSRG